MQLKKKTIEFVKNGEKKSMQVMYVEIMVNGKPFEVQLELFRKNNFIRNLLLEEIK